MWLRSVNSGVLVAADFLMAPAQLMALSSRSAILPIWGKCASHLERQTRSLESCSRQVDWNPSALFLRLHQAGQEWDPSPNRDMGGVDAHVEVFHIPPGAAGSKRKGGAKTAASTPLPRATMRGPILIPILQVPPGTCWLSAKSAARGCPSRRRWMIPSADSTCLTGWTRALCRRHGWRAAKRFSLSYAIDAFGSPPQSRIVL